MAIITLPMSDLCNAGNYGGDVGYDIINIIPTVFPLNLTGNDTIDFWTTAFDRNSESDLCGARLDIHQNTSINSDVIRYFVWYPSATSNMTVNFGTPSDDGIVSVEKLDISGSSLGGQDRLWVLWIFDDNFTSEHISTKIYRNYPLPFYYNINAYGSYIHRSDNNPTPTQAVDFTVWVEDYDTPEGSITVVMHYSTNNKVTWNTEAMTYDAITDNWGCQLGGYPAQTTVWYYVTADDGYHEVRTPATYDFIIWDNPPFPDNNVRSRITFYLKDGWNLVGTDLRLSIYSLQIASIPNINSVVKRNGDDEYLSANGEGFGDYFTITEFEGFYIHSNIDMTLALNGTNTRHTITFNKGHTLIGGVSYSSALQFLENINGETLTVRNSLGLYQTCVRTQGTNDFGMMRTQGYYVYLDQAKTIYWSN